MVANAKFITLQKLPITFTEKYGSALSNPLYLNPPDDTEWRVDWTNHDGEILFKKGWKEFVAYYSLDHGHLLWFEYNTRTSHIKVHIFDMSCLQIEYLPMIKSKSSCHAGGQLRKKLRALVSSASKGRQLRNDTQIRDLERSLSLHDIKSKEKNHEMPVSVNQDSNGKRNREKDSLSSVRPYPTRPESLKEAKKFKWEKPSFIIKITQRSQSRAPCYFPTKFFRKYFENNPQNANIRFGKKLFPAKLICRPSSCDAFISAGWNLFA
ncbi:hypothetical protein HN51_027094 [Arachis hypogaea]